MKVFLLILLCFSPFLAFGIYGTYNFTIDDPVFWLSLVSLIVGFGGTLACYSFYRAMENLTKKPDHS